jgi:hypothetical protein
MMIYERRRIVDAYRSIIISIWTSGGVFVAIIIVIIVVVIAV